MIKSKEYCKVDSHTYSFKKLLKYLLDWKAVERIAVTLCKLMQVAGISPSWEAVERVAVPLWELLEAAEISPSWEAEGRVAVTLS